MKQQAQDRKTRVPKLIFQDPAFCAADHRLLNGLGAQVLEDPMAFVVIDEKTLVFAKAIPLVIYFSGLLMTSPAVCISTVCSLSNSNIRCKTNNIASYRTSRQLLKGLCIFKASTTALDLASTSVESLTGSWLTEKLWTSLRLDFVCTTSTLVMT